MSSGNITAIVLDLYACVFLIVLLLSQRNRRVKDELLDQKLFKWLLKAILVILLLDTATWFVEGELFPGSIRINQLLLLLLYAFQPFPSLLYLCYCDAKLGAPLKEIKKRLPVYLIPIVINTLLVMTTPVSPVFFAVSPQNIYIRGPLFTFSYVLAYILLLVAVYKVFNALRLSKKRENPQIMNRSELFQLLFFPVPPLLGGLCQFFLPMFSMLWPSVVISLAIVNGRIQSIEAMTDSLTELYNRRRADIQFQRSFDSASSNNPMSVSILDIDSFKKINDRHGHASGDQALRLTAYVMRGTCESGEFIARFGGDEFLIIASCRENELRGVIDKMNARLAELCSERELPYSISLSAGIAQWSEKYRSAEAMLSEADKRLYERKSGK